ncbi:MAG: phage tail protein [Bacillota bacterium]
MTPYIVNKVSRKVNKVVGNRMDPYLTHSFFVEIDGITVAGFTDVSGLGADTEVERKSFGGENDREYSFITRTKYSDITLKHGVTNQDYLWRWYESVINGRVYRRNGSIYILDDSGKPAVWWDFYDACPIKWEGPAFNASGNSVAIETLVLTHQGLYRHR